MQNYRALAALWNSRRPVIIAGAGARGAQAQIVQLSSALGIPIAPTWAALDMFPDSVGSFGTHGNRVGNFVVQNADWILSIGSRLDTKATGTPEKTFASFAHKFVVDIDAAELAKFKKLGIEIEPIHCDAKEFMDAQLDKFLKAKNYNGEYPNYTGTFPNFYAWHAQIDAWKKRYPVHDSAPYKLIKFISTYQAQEDSIICCDTGCAIAWVCQAWQFKKGQRLLHAWNQTPMGYGLPAALGAYYATGKPVTLITGDGSFMMNLSELATIKGLPITIHLFDNQGHAMCRQTQREWLDGKYYATSLGDLKFPDFEKVAEAFEVDLRVYKIDPDCDVVPKVKFGYPNHDAFPLLERAELDQQMYKPEKTSCLA